MRSMVRLYPIIIVVLDPPSIMFLCPSLSTVVTIQVQSSSKSKIKVKSQSYIEGLGLRVSLFYCAIKYLFRIVTQSSGTLVSPIVKCWQ